MSEETNKGLQNEPKMTLKGYYMSLPDASHPKTDFMNDVARKCRVSVGAVRGWIFYGLKPQNKKNVEILARMTGIPATELWED